MPSEKIEVTAEPASFEDFMRGVEHQEGGQHDFNPRGMSSVPQDFNVNHSVDPPRPDRQESPLYNPQVHQFGVEAPNEPDWKRMYGQEANEKGQYRRTAEELAQLVEQLRAERAVWQQAQQQGAPGYGYQPPQWQQAPQLPAQPQIPDTYFEGKDENDMVEVREMNRILRQMVAPAVWQLHTQQLALQQQQVAAQKMVAGITPAVEQRLLATRPWLASLPEGTSRIQAMQEILRQEASQANGQVTPPQQQVLPPHQSAVRRVTYVEPGTGQRADDSNVDPNERFKQEWAKTTTATEKRKLLERYGVGRANDFGPAYYTR